MIHFRKHIALLFLPALMLVVGGCSTQKANWTNIAYHNTTCHYNVWWNGKESYKEGIKKLGKDFNDDYTQILPVYQIGTKEQAMGIYPQMDKAIEKGIKGIKKHSIYIQGREYVKYVKNCYLLTAYSTFQKQDYAATANTCRLIMTQFSGSEESDEARILLARCLTQEKQYADAEQALEMLVTDQAKDNFSSKLADKLYMAMIECVLPQEKYKKAVQYIRLAIDETTDRSTKARLYFIMAQIYQKLDKRPTATKYFGKVLKCRPDYVMEFNARINIASCASEEHTNLAEVERSLDKMLKDKKNEEFKDQIYYAKAEMYMGMKDAKKACDNYRMSVAAAANNPSQKAKSALRMADVLYDMYENYDEAQKYYDTAMRIIQVGYPHYDEIRSRYNTLTALVENTRLIYRNDSLFMWADMNPAERSALIEKKIAELKQREKEEAERQLIADLNQDAMAQRNTLQGDWYFYNHNTVSKGKQTFRQRWGVRVLDDYWFLSKRTSFTMGSMIPGMENYNDDELSDQDSVASDSTMASGMQNGENPDDPHYAAYYLKDLPKTQGQRDTMHMEIARCLLNAGYIYYDGIENTDRALECYLRLAKDYPDADEIVQAFYQLWRIYSKQGNTPQANYYKDMVLMGFPDCDYANMIRDDQYYLEIIERSEVAQNEYSTVYGLYRRKKYRDVVAHVDEALKLYNEQPLMGKFRYWKGLASAQMGDTAMATLTFETIIADYADTTRLSILAKEQLAYLRTGYFTSSGESISSDDEEKAKKRYKENVRDVADVQKVENQSGNAEELPAESLMYRYRENMQHYVAVLINDKKIVATQLQYSIADFNMKYYSNSGYRASPLLFTDTVQMLTIHRFKNAQEAEEYRTHLLLEEGPLTKYDPKDYIVFSISTQNYNTFYNQKNIDAYRRFYEYYYKPKKQ
ncbi:MAG: tetratricopeptide repeat protein [Bacteroidales bacterium]|nr:tetratricopeptide repeat protein [Bacteroidales bacterium]